MYGRPVIWRHHAPPCSTTGLMVAVSKMYCSVFRTFHPQSVSMSELRQRQQQPRPLWNPASPSGTSSERSGNNGNGVSLLDVIRVLVTLTAVTCLLSYYTTSSESFLFGYRPWFTRWPVVLQYIVSRTSFALQRTTRTNNTLCGLEWPATSNT